MALPIGKIESPENLGEMIRTRRRELGLSQADLAGLCGVGTRFVSELERGKPTARLGLALVVARNLGLVLEIRLREWDGGGP